MGVNIGSLEGVIRLKDEFSSVLTRAASQLEQSSAKIKKLGSDLSDVGGRLTQSLTLPIVAIGGAAVKLASDFESSFAGVRKTVDATEEQFNDLAQSFRNMAKEIPVSVNELNNVAEAAGQLGIKVADIEEFTRVMIDLARTTNLTSDEAATSIAQFQNIFGAAGKEVDRFGATLVALGNAGASTEKSILEMGVRIAGAGNQIGLTQGEVLAFASALSSLGIEAEAGGSAISKVMINMALAVSRGGEELASFAEIAGQTSAQFAESFRNDASQAVQSFITGLSSIQQSGGDVLTVLDQMEITEVRMRDALLRAAGAGDLLTDALKLQSTAWQENSALTIEAQKRYQTFGSQVTIFLNNLKDVGITLGQALLPVLRDVLELSKPLIELLAKLAEKFSQLPDGVKATALAITALLAAVGPVLLVAGNLITTWGTIAAFMPKVAAAIGTVTGVLTGPVGLIAGIAALVLSWKPAREFLVDLVGNLVSRVVNGVKSITDKFKDWWKSTEDVRKYLSELARVITDDVIKAVNVTIALIGTWVTQQIELTKALRDTIAEILSGTGVLSGLAHSVIIAANALRLLHVWAIKVKNEFIALANFAAAFGAVAVALNPSMKMLVLQLSSWSKEASRNIKEQKDVKSAVDDLALSSEELSKILAAGLIELKNIPAITKKVSAGLSVTNKDVSELRSEFESLIDSTLTAQEKAGQSLKRLQELMSQGVGTADEYRVAFNRLLIEMVSGSKELDKVEIGAAVVDVEGIVAAIRKAFNIDPSVYNHSLEKFRQAVTDTLDDIDTSLSFALELSGIDETDEHLRRVEESYIGLLQRTGASTVEAAERALEYIASTLGVTVDEIKAKLGQLDDVAIARQYQGAGNTPFEIYKREREQIERLMRETHVTVKDGTEALRNLQLNYWSSVLSDAKQITGQLADTFGGFFSYLDQAASVLQNAINAYTSASNLATKLGGGANMASAFGAVGAYIAVATAAYDAFTSHRDSRRARQYDYAGSLSFSDELGGFDLSSNLDAATRQLAMQIQSSVQALVDAIGGSLVSLEEIEIEVRKDGKYFLARVGETVIGHFNSLNEAVSAAIAQAFADPETSIRGLSDLVRQGMQELFNSVEFKSGAIGAEELQDYLVALREISELDTPTGIIELRDQLSRFDDMWSVVTQNISQATPAVMDALGSIGSHIVSTIQGAYDRLYGVTLSPQEQRARLEQEAKLVDAEKHLRIAEIEARIAELKALDAAVSGRRDLLEQGIELDQADIAARQAALRAKAEQVQAEMTIAQAQINALEQVAALLRAMPDADLTRIRLPGGAGGGRRQQGADFVEQLMDVVASGASGLSRSLSDLRDRMRELAETQARLGVDTVLFKEAMEELQRQLRAQVRDLVDAALGGGSEWEQRAEEIRARWQEVTDAVREHLEETGERLVPFWQINAAMAAELRELAEDAIGSLGLPLEQIRSQFAALTDTLSFLEQMVTAGIITADRYREVLGQVGQQMTVSIGRDILNFIDQWGIEIKDVEELRRKLTKMDIDMQILGWKTQIALAASMKLITEAQQNEFNAIIAEIEGQLPDILDNIGESVDDIADAADNLSQSIQDMYHDQQQQLQQEIQRAMDLLNRYREDGLTPFQRDLARIEEDFALIRARLGNTLEVQELYAAALQRLHDQYLDTIRDFQQSFIFSDQSPLTLNQQFNAAMSQFQDILGQVTAGDLSLAGNLPNLAQQLFTLYAQMVPTGSEAYRDFFDLIMAQLTDISGVIVPPTATTPPVSNVIPFPGNPTAQFNDSLTSAINSSSSNEVLELTKVKNATIRVAEGVEELIDKVAVKPNPLRVAV